MNIRMGLYHLFFYISISFFMMGFDYTCQNKAGILVGQSSLIVSERYNFQLCYKINKSLDLDSSAILDLSLTDIYNGSGQGGYEYAEILVQIIEFIGEDEYIKVLSNSGRVSKEEFKEIKSVIEVGISFLYFHKKEITFDTLFPKLNVYLDKNIGGKK